MEKLLSDTWTNVFLNEVKEEALVNARNNSSELREQSVYLFDNSKMEGLKSDVVVVDNGNLNVVLVSKDVFAKALDGEVADRDSVVAKAQEFVTTVASNKNAVKMSGEEFTTWAQTAGLSDVASLIAPKKKLKM